MDTDKIRRSAIWYARHGWYVVPLHAPLFTDGKCCGCTCEFWRRSHGEPDYICRTPGKHPRRRDWEATASNNPETVATWWSRVARMNVGIAAGRSGLLAVDADLYKEHAPVTWDTRTVTSLTGGGGEHLIYQMPDGATWGNATGNLPHGLDIRGHGGQFVAPPSLHPSGRFYEWEDGYGPHQLQPLAVPAELAALLAGGPKPGTFSGSGSADLARWQLPALVQAVIEGDRSRIVQGVIGALIRAGASDDDIRAVVQAHDITGKYADKGSDADRWLALSIGNARAWVASRPGAIAEQERVA